MKQFWIAVIFYITESLATSILMGAVECYMRASTGSAKAFVFLVRDVFFAFAARIFLLQFIIELIIIFLIIRFNGWDKIWIVLPGVFISVIVWGGLQGIAVGFDFGMLKFAIQKNWQFLFLGTLFSWWFCYKWIGLKA
jgi:hypothetical protein